MVDCLLPRLITKGYPFLVYAILVRSYTPCSSSLPAWLVAGKTCLRIYLLLPVFASLAGCWQTVPTYLSIAVRLSAYSSAYSIPIYLSVCLSVCLSVYLQNHLLYIIIKKNKQALAGDW